MSATKLRPTPTVGPLLTHFNGLFWEVKVPTDDHVPVGDLPHTAFVFGEHAEGDARLYAGAWGLLKACKVALADLEFISGETADDQPTARALRAAIAKAEG